MAERKILPKIHSVRRPKAYPFANARESIFGPPESTNMEVTRNIILFSVVLYSEQLHLKTWKKL